MKSTNLRILLAVGLTLMWVQFSAAVDGRSNSIRHRVAADEEENKAVLNQNFKVEYGKEVTIKGTSLKVRFDSVLDDSRCPRDVTCVWAGDAKILISVRQANAKASKVELHTSSQLGQTGKYKRYVIKLIALDPYPMTRAAKAKPDDYVATLLIKKE
jgi:hypothetical protein